MDSFWAACAAGNVERVAAMLAEDAGWANRVDERGMPPLVATTFSDRLRDAEAAKRIRECARLLLQAGADPNGSWTNEFGPLSALYGAAGMHHDPLLTEMLLEAGADVNDNESLYHSLESPDDACLRMVLAAGARVTGTNAFFHALDYERPDRVRLLLAHGADANEESGGLGRPLGHALRRARSLEIVRLLLDAGANGDATVFRMAARLGRSDVTEELRSRGAWVESGEDELFIGACARGDEAEASAILAGRPGLMKELREEQLQTLPMLAQSGNDAGVRVMVRLGWPVAVRGGDWKASALNFAVFRGNADLVRFLLAHGARWTERHGYNDNAMGTLSFASQAKPVEGGDWVACAQALLEAGMPAPPAQYKFTPEVDAVFAGMR